MAERPNLYRATVLRELQASASQLGLKCTDLTVTTNLPTRKVTGALSGLIRDKQIFSINLGRFSRYFATAEQREAGCEAVLAEHKRQVLENKRKNERAARARKKALYQSSPEFLARDIRKAPVKAPKPAREPKPAKAVKAPKLAQPRPVNRENLARRKWAEQTPIVPPHVKPIDCGGFKGITRFDPAPGHFGEFTRAGIGRYLDEELV